MQNIIYTTKLRAFTACTENYPRVIEGGRRISRKSNFKLADMDTLLVRMDEWFRRRLRMIIWKTWKHVRTRLSNLLKLGVHRQRAWEWANTRKGYWHIANSFLLNTTITTDRLRLAGYVFLSDYYRNVRVVN